jgi:hypothetical protein
MSLRELEETDSIDIAYALVSVVKAAPSAHEVPSESESTIRVNRVREVHMCHYNSKWGAGDTGV